MHCSTWRLGEYQHTRQPWKLFKSPELIGKYNETLNKHLHTPAMKCVTYMSPQTQNELLEVMAKHIILRDIVKEIKQARYYSIMTDEVTSHNVQQLAFCVRFVDADSDQTINLCKHCAHSYDCI